MKQQRFRSGGVAAWSIRHPIGVVMLCTALIVIGLFSLQRLGIDLLPHIIYPEIRVRVLDPGISPTIMEDNITRQLEEQLAITENAIAVESRTSRGRSAVDLDFPYGTDIDIALRDASTRLDRARRFLPDTIEPPVIYKRDPSQIPVLEFIISSPTIDSVALRTWADYSFSKWLVNLPGVAAIEVGGGLRREIHIIVDQEKLAAIGLSTDFLVDFLEQENSDDSTGRMIIHGHEMSTRTHGRFNNVQEIRELPIHFTTNDGESSSVNFGDIAKVIDSHSDEKLRIRYNGIPGIKISVQKQPQANTVEVNDVITQRIEWMMQQHLIPEHIQVNTVDDQSTFIRHALNNASLAAASGAVLAMLVVYLFLGDIRRTLIIGTALPIAFFVTFMIMDINGLTLNIMTLGGLALGMGMLVDSTIVMLENISRHQHSQANAKEASIDAAREVNSPIVASTSTNLAAVLPFLFISGLVGLLFRELIITITAAMLSSMLIALTLVPALGSRVAPLANKKFSRFDRLANWYTALSSNLLKKPLMPLLVLLPFLLISVYALSANKQIFLPRIDEGQIYLSINGEAGINLEKMDRTVERLENLLFEDSSVKSLFTMSGGFVFGRSEYENSNYSSIRIQLHAPGRRIISSEQWIKQFNEKIDTLKLTGYRVRMRIRGVRGVRTGRGDDDISIRVQGDDLGTLKIIGNNIVDRLKLIDGLRNVKQSYEQNREELSINIHRTRTADLGIRVDQVKQALTAALDGIVVSDYLEGDRQYDIRMYLSRELSLSTPALMNTIVGLNDKNPIRLRDVADISQQPEPAEILRDRQRRIVEISASINESAVRNEVTQGISQLFSDLDLPAGYLAYDGGETRTLKEGKRVVTELLALAIFLVFVVMAVQYESLINPLIILISIPFALVGVTAGLEITGIPLSMPVWLGLIMLAGIVVNNAIVLVEQIEIERERLSDMNEAIVSAAKLRLRPIMMTTLTTVAGMTPLAIGVGEGAEMLQPLAIVIVFGLSFSMLVSLVLIPSVYKLLHGYKYHLERM